MKKDCQKIEHIDLLSCLTFCFIGKIFPKEIFSSCGIIFLPLLDSCKNITKQRKHLSLILPDGIFHKNSPSSSLFVPGVIDETLLLYFSGARFIGSILGAASRTRILCCCNTGSLPAKNRDTPSKLKHCLGKLLSNVYNTQIVRDLPTEGLEIQTGGLKWLKMQVSYVISFAKFPLTKIQNLLQWGLDGSLSPLQILIQRLELTGCTCGF